MLAAHKAFYKQGLAPPRLFSGDNWYIVPWLDQKARTEEPTTTNMAKLLAKSHNIPTAWFEPYRQKIVKKYPDLAKARPGCHVWYHTCKFSS
jgi:hypothetical protein